MAMNEFGLSESPAIEVFQDIGYEYKEGSEISPNGEDPERNSFSEVVLRDRLRKSLKKLNDDSIPDKVIQEAVSGLLGFSSPRLLRNNEEFHEELVNGIKVEYEKGGEQIGDRLQVIDFDNPNNNDFLVTNQFPIKIGERPKRVPDILVFLNGLPVGVFELKDPTNPQATIKNDAFPQVTETYERDIPDLFNYNEFIVVMDKNNAKVGCLGSDWDWFSPWNYIKEEGDTYTGLSPSEILIRGLFNKERVLDVLQNFIIFDEEDGKLSKKLAVYHQFYAVNEAYKNTKKTLFDDEDRRIGVVWHTQGSGKSLSMVFYTNKIRNLGELGNPTILVLTDRTALDDQIHETFADAGFQTQHAKNIENLREILSRESGGLLFTNIQKFQTKDKENEFPEINSRKDIIVIADEAHRSQYKELGENVRLDALPNASFIGFTATPIEKQNRSTYITFGELISEYPIDLSEKDGSTVPIYYESRMAKLHLDNEEIEKKFNELLESESNDLKNEMIGRWTALRNLIENHNERLETISEDIVDHYLNRELEGKAMVVTIGRKAAYKYKEQIQKYLVEKANGKEAHVVITDAEEYVEDPLPERELKSRFKDIDDSFEIAVVCKKWTTGFDVPHLHTMYIDRPMKNHNLFQTIGRVNRVYKDKPGGLIVDYIGIGDNLKKALDKYSSEIQEKALTNLDEAIELFKEKHEKVSSYFKNIDYKSWQDKSGLKLQRLVHKAENEVLETQETEEEFKDDVYELSKLYSLISPHETVKNIRSDMIFFRAVKDSIEKPVGTNEDLSSQAKKEKIDSAMKELVAENVSVEELVEMSKIKAEGIQKPILSRDFLEEVRNINYPNLQVRMLERILKNKIIRGKKRNKARYESFEEKLKDTIRKYNNNFLKTKEVIKELFKYAEELQEEENRTERLNLSEEELAFYDALSSKGNKELPEEELRDIARELKDNLKENADLDWTNRSQLRAKMKVEVKNILRSRGFTHVEYEPLVEPIVEQAEVLFAKK